MDKQKLTTAGVVIAGVFVLASNITLTDGQAIRWDKPVTEKGWREDIKKESLDIRSLEELEAMLVSHTEKLDKILKDTRSEDCPECVKYDLRKDAELSYGLEGRALNRLVDDQFADLEKNRRFEIEKLKQSIERINKAIELKQ